MASLNDLIVRVGVEGIPAFKGAFRDAVEALDLAGERASQAGKRISGAFSNLGIEDSSAKIAAQVAKLNASFNSLEKSFKDGKITAEDYAKAQAGLRVSLEKLAAPTQTLTEKLERLGKTGDAMKNVGSALTAAISLPIAGAAIAVTKFAADFELAMRQVTSLLGKDAAASFKPLSDGVLELSKRLGVDAVGAARALYEAISAGVPKENVLAFIEVASKAAIAGVTQTKVAVDGMTTIMNSYRLEAGKAAEVSDAMFQAVNLGKFTFEQLAASMSVAAPIAAQVGVGFKDLLAAAATLTSKGVPVSEAMTQIAAAMRSIIAPSKEMEALFAKIGVSSGEALIKSKGLQGALEAVRDAAGGSSDVLSKATGRIEGFNAILSLTGENSKKAREDLKSLNDSIGATDAAFAEIEKSFSRQLDAFTAQAKALGIELGTALLPFAKSALEAIKPLISVIGELAQGFKELPSPVQLAVGGFAALAAAAGPALFAFGGMADGAAALISVLGKLGGAGAGATGLAGTISTLGAAITALGPAAAILAGVATAGYGLYSLKPQAEELSAVLRQVAKDYQGYIDTLKAGAEAAAKPFAMMGEQAVVVAGFLAELSPAFVSARAGINAFREDAASTAPVFGEVSKAFEDMRSRFTLFDLTGFGLATAAVREWGIVTIDVLKRVTGSYPEMAAAAERNLARVQKANADAMRVPLAGITGVASVRSDVSANLAELKSAQETLSLLKKMKASKEELAEATTRVTNAQRKLHPELTATGNAAGSIASSFKQAKTEIKQFGEGIPVLIIKEYEAKIKALKVSIARATVEMALAKQAGKDWTGQLENNIAAAEKLTTELMKSAKNVFPEYVVGLGQIKAATKDGLVPKGLTEELTAAVESGKQQFKELSESIKAVESDDEVYRSVGLKTLVALQEEASRTAEAYRRISAISSEGSVNVLTAQQKDLEAQREVAIATGKAWDGIDDQLSRVADRLARATSLKGVSDLQAAFLNFANAAGSAITKSFGDAFDALIKGDFKGVGKAFSSMWKGVAESAVKTFTDPLKNALGEFFGKTVRDLLKGSLSGVKEDIKDIASVIKGLLGIKDVAKTGVDAVNAAKTGVDAVNAAKTGADAASAAASGAKAAGSIGSAAATGGTTAIVGAVSGVVSAVSGVISNFQFSAMNKALDNIVKHTLQTANDLANLRSDSWLREGHLFTKLDDLLKFTWVKLDDIVKAVRGLSFAAAISSSGEVTADIIALQQIFIAITEGASSVVSAISDLGATLQSALGTTASTIAGTNNQIGGSIERLTAQLGTASTANEKIEADIAATKKALQDLGEKNAAQREALLAKLGELTLKKNENDALISTIKIALKTIGDYGEQGIKAGEANAEKVVASLESLQVRLANLVQQQATFLAGLPPDIKAALDAGKLAELVNGQDQATKDALAGYLKITNELKQVRDAINALKPAAEATATASASSAFALDQVRANIIPTNGGFDTSSVLAGLAAFSDRMAGYWERLFEVLAAGGINAGGGSATGGGAGGGGVQDQFASAEAARAFLDSRNGAALTEQDLAKLRNTPGVQFREVGESGSSSITTLGGAQATSEFQRYWDAREKFLADEKARPLTADEIAAAERLAKYGGAAAQSGSEFQRYWDAREKFLADEKARPLTADEIAAAERLAKYGGAAGRLLPGSALATQLGGADEIAAYYDQQFQSAVLQSSAALARKGVQSYDLSDLPATQFSPATSLYPVNSAEWKASQMDWQNTRAPQVSNWTPTPAAPSGGGGYPMPPQIPIQVAIDGKVIAERMAVYYEQLGYR